MLVVPSYLILSCIMTVHFTVKSDFKSSKSSHIDLLQVYYIEKPDEKVLLPFNLTPPLILKKIPAVSVLDIELMVANGTFVFEGFDRASDKRFCSNKIAWTLSHLKTIQEAYSGGYDFVLIVEKYSFLVTEFLENLRTYTDLAPVDWTILQWITTSRAVTNRRAYRSNDFWISWSGHHRSTNAYTIRREGMRRILNLTSNFFMGQYRESFKWKIGETNMVASDELLYLLAGNTYTFTYSWIPGGKHNFNLISQRDDSIGFDESRHVSPINEIKSSEREESLLVIQNILMRSVEEVQVELCCLNADIRALARVNPRSYWFVKIVLRSIELLPSLEISNLKLFHKHLRLNVEVSKSPYNKFLLAQESLDMMSRFDLVLLKDNDISLAGFEWNTFLNIKNDSIISAPFRISKEGLTDRQRMKIDRLKNASDYVVNLQDGLLFNNPLDTNYQEVRRVPTMALEMFMVLMMSDFAIWFFKQVLTNEFLSQEVPWGLDLMWCGAALDYKSKVLGRQECIPCSLVSVNIVHRNTRQLLKPTSFIRHGKELINRFRKRNATKNWLQGNNKFRCHYHKLLNWCKENSVGAVADCFNMYHHQKVQNYTLKSQSFS